VATLNSASATDAPVIDETPQADGEGNSPAAPEQAAGHHRGRGRRRVPAPHSPLASSLGIATVCALVVIDLMGIGPAATASPQEQSASTAVADALGVDGTGVDTSAMQDPELLTQLAASRSQRDADQAAAAQTQAQAEQAAVAAKAEAEAKAAAEAAAAAAAEAEAAKSAEAAQAAQAAQAGNSAAVAPSTAVNAVAKITNTAGPVRPQAQAAANVVVSNVPGADSITIGGTRSSAADPHGHPSGLALDYMVGSDTGLGDAITAYHIAHWDELGVEYIIWQQRMLSSPNGSWKTMEDRGSATANHMDHPHVNYLG
jgi:hypothetical protein